MKALRINVSLPCLRLGMGPFSIDPLEQLFGARVCDLLGPMAGPMTQRRTATGQQLDVYPLTLPEGQGVTLPLGAFGEVGLFNDDSVLVLTVPALAVPFLRARLGHVLVGSPTPSRSTDGRSLVVDLRVQLRPGTRATFPLGALGEMGLEASD